VALYVLERAGGAADGGPAAPVKSRAEQRIENGLLIIMLRLNYSSERHLEKVTLKVSIILSKYCKNVFFLYVAKRTDYEMRVVFRCVVASTSPAMPSPPPNQYIVTPQAE